MKHFYNLIFLAVFCCTAFHFSACANNKNNESEEKANHYIYLYKDLAIDEMHRTGVPASVKLAQAMLESGYGESRLASNGNNHFGIKCKSYWRGDTIKINDDAPQECFRRYSSVRDSYIDHSDFLYFHRYGHYRHLFDLHPFDYSGWAKGLKAAGYATNPKYADLVINFIEKYRLYEFDRIQQGQALAAANSTKSNSNSIAENSTSKPALVPDETAEIIVKPEFPDIIDDIDSDEWVVLPEDELVETQLAISIPFRLKRIKINGCEALLANHMLSAITVSKQFGISKKKLYKNNDLAKGSSLQAHVPIFLDKKKGRLDTGPESHTIRVEDNMHQLSQRYGIKLKKLYKLNKMPKGSQPQIGEQLYLRNKARVRPILKISQV